MSSYGYCFQGVLVPLPVKNSLAAVVDFIGSVAGVKRAGFEIKSG